MPIKRLTRGPALPRLGILRKGAKKGANRPGKNLTYFRIDTPFDDLEKAFYEKFGKEPREIPVYLPFPDIEQNWAAWQEEWKAGGLVHRCDGETMILWRKSNGKMSTDEKPCPFFTGEKQRTTNNPGCTPVGRLKVIIPDLSARFGFFTVQTTSENDIVRLDSLLKGYFRIAGNLTGIRFTLSRRPEKISVPMEDGKRVRKEEWLLNLEVDPTWAQYQLLAARTRAMTLPVDITAHETDVRVVPMLTSGEVVDAETGEIIDAPADVPVEALPEEPKERAKRLSEILYGDTWKSRIANVIAQSTDGKKKTIESLSQKQLADLVKWLDAKVADEMLGAPAQGEPPW